MLFDMEGMAGPTYARRRSEAYATRSAGKDRWIGPSLMRPSHSQDSRSTLKQAETDHDDT